MAIPLRSRDRTLGVIGMHRLGKSPHYTKADQEFVEDLADRAALAIDNACLLAELRQRDRFLEIVTDSLPVLVAYVGADERYRFVNHGVESWFRRSKDELLGHTVRDIVGESAYGVLHPSMLTALAGHELSFDAEIPYGDAAPRFVRTSYIPHMSGCNVEGYVELVLDLTAERRAEHRDRLLAETTRALGVSLDAETTLDDVAQLMVPRFADTCAIEVFDSGVPRKTRFLAVAATNPVRVNQLKELRRLYPGDPELRSGGTHVMHTRRAELIPSITEQHLQEIADDADYLSMLRALDMKSAMVAPFASGERMLGMMTFLSHESNRRFDEADLALAEEIARRAAIAVENANLYHDARAAVGVRDDFLSVASHELRTPLTSLQLQLQSLQRHVVKGANFTPDELKARLAKLCTQVARLGRLSTSLLDATRISGGRLAIVPEPFDLVALVREILERFADELAQAGVTCCADASVVGCWDRERVDQVVTNLVTNAIKYGLGRPIQVSVGADGAWATLTVEDHGMGIESSDHQRIFDRFERTTSAENHGGLGLGLWIANQMVRAHGGSIALESAPNAGSRFTVRLPISP